MAKSAKIAKDFSITVDQHEASTEKMNHEKAELREKIWFDIILDSRIILDLTSIGYKHSVALISLLVPRLMNKALTTGCQCCLQRGDFEKDSTPKLVPLVHQILKAVLSNKIKIKGSASNPTSCIKTRNGTRNQPMQAPLYLLSSPVCKKRRYVSIAFRNQALVSGLYQSPYSAEKDLETNFKQ